MDHEPLSNDVLSAIDACRPQRGDERLPEVAAALSAAPAGRVAEVRRSVERVDRAIMAAIQQAPVPAGLADRLLTRIDAAALDGDGEETQGASRAAPACRETEVSALDCGERDLRRGHRARHWVMAGGACALAASLLAAFVLWPRERLELADVQAQARELYDADNHGADLSMDDHPTPLGGVRSNAVRGWRPVRFLGRGGYAYELTSGRVQAALYVVPLGGVLAPRLNVPSTPASPGTLGASGISGLTVTSWTDNQYVYVLVVKGSEGAIRNFLPRSVA
ncbi:MAG TPA: hypothetical protein VHC22_20730 [Pirellulales bacterium]|nr:hypothetical protein [Pirellulales bacterium]